MSVIGNVVVVGERPNYFTKVSKNNVYSSFKKVFDIALATIMLLVLIIPMILISIVIKLTSRGPVLFKQERTGLNGDNFTLYKFRTMSQSNNVLNFKTENEITKVGKFLRKTSLDEIPQLFNIIKGEMSFIGPRPWIPEYYKNFTVSQKRRVNVLPGITGLAQATGRNNLSIFDKIACDIEYVNNYSFIMDINVIKQTVKTILSKDGAELPKSGIKTELEELKENYLSVTGSLPTIDEAKYSNNQRISIN